MDAAVLDVLGVAELGPVVVLLVAGGADVQAGRHETGVALVLSGKLPLLEGLAAQAALLDGRDDPVDRGAALVDEHAEQVLVHVLVGALDHVLVEHVGARVLDAELLLDQGVAADEAAAAAAHAAAEPVHLLEHEHVGAGAGGLDGSRSAAAAAAHDDDLGLVVPVDVVGLDAVHGGGAHLGLLGQGAGGGAGGDGRGGGARGGVLQEIATVHLHFETPLFLGAVDVFGFPVKLVLTIAS